MDDFVDFGPYRSFNKSLNDIIDEPFKEWGSNCGIDRCLDSQNNIMHMHLGRGTTKQENKYFKLGKKLFPEWIDICNNII